MTPLGKYVFIKLNPKQKGNLILPNEKSNNGVVQDVGGMVRRVSKGQEVYFSAGAVIEMESKEFVVVHEDNIWLSKKS